MFISIAFTNASQTYSKNKWYVSESTPSLMQYFDFKFADLGLVREGGKYYNAWQVNFSLRIKPPIQINGEITNLTNMEKWKECVSLSLSDKCIQEFHDWYYPELDFKDFVLEVKNFSTGLKSQILSYNADITPTNFNLQNLSGTMRIRLYDGFRENEKIKFGSKSITYTSGSITIEYVELLPEPENLNCTLQLGGTLDASTIYVIVVASTWDNSNTIFGGFNSDRRYTNYSRNFVWTYITTNTTHKSVNCTWNDNRTTTNTTRYWVKMQKGNYGATEMSVYSTWQCMIPHSYSNNICFTGATHSLGNCDGTTCWFYKNTTTFLGGAEYNSELSGYLDLKLPLFRCWGNGADMDDFYDADVNSGWGFITRENQTTLSLSYPSKGQYSVNGSLQVGNFYNGNCTFTSTNEDIQVAENFFITNGSATFGALATNKEMGSGLFFNLPYGTAYLGELYANINTQVFFYVSYVSWMSGAKPNYLYGVHGTFNGKFYSDETNFNHFASLYFKSTANWSLKNAYLTNCHYCVQAVVGGILSNVQLADANYGVLSPDTGTMYATGLTTDNNGYDMYMYRNSVLNSTDTTLEHDKLYFLYSNNRWYDYKNFTLKLVYQNGTPISGASVLLVSPNPELWNRTGGAVGTWTFLSYQSPYTHINTTTDANGEISDLFLYRYIKGCITGATCIDRSMNETRYYNITLTINKTGYDTINFTTNITGASTWRFTLNASTECGTTTTGGNCGGRVMIMRSKEDENQLNNILYLVVLATGVLTIGLIKTSTDH